MSIMIADKVDLRILKGDAGALTSALAVAKAERAMVKCIVTRLLTVPCA
jgi:hypothetical protein